MAQKARPSRKELLRSRMSTPRYPSHWRRHQASSAPRGPAMSGAGTGPSSGRRRDQASTSGRAQAGFRRRLRRLLRLRLRRRWELGAPTGGRRVQGGEEAGPPLAVLARAAARGPGSVLCSPPGPARTCPSSRRPRGPARPAAAYSPLPAPLAVGRPRAS